MFILNQNIASKLSYWAYWCPTQAANLTVVTTSSLLFVISIYQLCLKLEWKLFETGMRPIKCPTLSTAFVCSANINSISLQLWKLARSKCIHRDSCMHNCMENACEIYIYNDLLLSPPILMFFSMYLSKLVFWLCTVSHCIYYILKIKAIKKKSSMRQGFHSCSSECNHQLNLIKIYLGKIWIKQKVKIWLTASSMYKRTPNPCCTLYSR